jgi:hypothetical protein
MLLKGVAAASSEHVRLQLRAGLLVIDTAQNVYLLHILYERSEAYTVGYDNASLRRNLYSTANLSFAAKHVGRWDGSLFEFWRPVPSHHPPPHIIFTMTESHSPTCAPASKSTIRDPSRAKRQ